MLYVPCFQALKGLSKNIKLTEFPIVQVLATRKKKQQLDDNNNIKCNLQLMDSNKVSRYSLFFYSFNIKEYMSNTDQTTTS